MTYEELVKTFKNPALPVVTRLKKPEDFMPSGAKRGLLEHEAREYMKYLTIVVDAYNRGFIK